MPASSSAPTMARTCSSVNWWRLACEPSRRLVSVTRMSRSSEYVMASSWSGARGEQLAGGLLAHLGGRRGHDVEVAGVRRQVVAGSLDLEERGDPSGAVVQPVELRLAAEAVAGDVGLHLLDHVADRVGHL